jgi:hypothetical protein
MLIIKLVLGTPKPKQQAGSLYQYVFSAASPIYRSFFLILSTLTKTTLCTNASI